MLNAHDRKEYRRSYARFTGLLLRLSIEELEYRSSYLGCQEEEFLQRQVLLWTRANHLLSHAHSVSWLQMGHRPDNRRLDITNAVSCREIAEKEHQRTDSLGKFLDTNQRKYCTLNVFYLFRTLTLSAKCNIATRSNLKWRPSRKSSSLSCIPGRTCRDSTWTTTCITISKPPKRVGTRLA